MTALDTPIAYPRIRWLVLAMLFASYFVVGMMLVTFSPVIGLVAADFGITPGEATFFATGLFMAASVVSSFVSGPLADRFGAFPVMLTGVILYVVSAILIPALSTSLAGFITIRILMGLGQGPIMVSAGSAVARWFPAKERSFSLGIMAAGFPIGLMAAFSLISFGLQLYSEENWRAAVSLLMVGPIAVAILSVITVVLAKESSLPDEDLPVNIAVDTGSESDFLYVVKQPVLYMIVVIASLYMWLSSTLTDMGPGYLAIDPPMGVGYGPVEAGYLMNFLTFGNLFGSIVIVGFMLEKVLKRKAKPLIMAAFLIMFVAILAIKFPVVYENPAMLRLALFAAGIGCTCAMTPLVVFVTTNFPAQIVGKILSIVYGIYMIVGAAGMSINSAALYNSGTYQLPLTIVSIVAIAGFIPAALLYVPKRFRGFTAGQTKTSECIED